MGWIGILLRVLGTVANFFALLTLPVVTVTVLSRGELITLGQSILIFAACMTAALVIAGVIWAFGW